MADLETRDLEYFVAVAEELHFGRAAARLSIAQPALSRAVQRVETRIGTPLLRRNSRQVALTPAGVALLDHGRVALGALTAAVQSARQAGEGGERHLRLVMRPGGDAGLLSSILTTYGSIDGARPVDILFGGLTDRPQHLRDGRADVGLLYDPFDDVGGLRCETLLVEGSVAVLPDGHRLAERADIAVGDLVDEPRPHWKGLSDGATGPLVESLVEMFQLVAIGRVVAVVPESLIGAVPPGIACVSLRDGPESRIVIATVDSDDSPSAHIHAFVAAARQAVAPRARGRIASSTSPPRIGEPTHPRAGR